MLHAVDYAIADVPPNEIKRDKVKKALHWAIEHGLNDKVEIQFNPNEPAVVFTRWSVLRKKLQEWLADVHGATLAAEPDRKEQHSPKSMLSGFLVKHPSVLDACAEFVKPPTLQRMPPDRLKRVVAPATQAMQHLWKQLESTSPMTVEGMVQAITNATFAAVDPDVVQMANIIQDITEAGTGLSDLAGESAVFARVAEVFAAGTEAVLEVRPRVASLVDCVLGGAKQSASDGKLAKPSDCEILRHRIRRVSDAELVVVEFARHHKSCVANTSYPGHV